jgi:drug efflux transport system permease protein
MRASWERLLHVLRKEFIQTFRDPRMRVTLMATPLLQLFLYGYAFNLDITNIRMALVDLDRSQESRELVRRFEGSGYFRVVSHTDDPDTLRELLDRSRVKVALQFDPGFADDLRRGRTAVVQLIVDGTDSNTAAVVSGYTARILEAFNHERAAATPVFPGASLRSATAIVTPAPRIELQARSWYNPDLKSRNYLVPGVIAMLLFITCLQLTSMAVVREREIGTMEQLLVTPLRPAELILGKTLPFALIGFVDTAVVTVVAVGWFRVPFRGSLALLFGASALFLLSALGIGLYVSTLARTQQQALMGMFFVAQPAVLLSGFIFPIADMPVAIQYLTLANPLRHFLVIIRGIFLKGNGVVILWPHMAALLVIGMAVLAISTLRFRRQLE